MPSKIPPLSIRPGPERLARIDAYASEHKLSRHLAVMLMLDEGYRSLSNSAATLPLKVGDTYTVEGDPGVRKVVAVTTAAKPIKSRLKGEWKAP